VLATKLCTTGCLCADPQRADLVHGADRADGGRARKGHLIRHFVREVDPDLPLYDIRRSMIFSRSNAGPFACSAVCSQCSR
jgi:hypothetical protein